MNRKRFKFRITYKNIKILHISKLSNYGVPGNGICEFKGMKYKFEFLEDNRFSGYVYDLYEMTMFDKLKYNFISMKLLSSCLILVALLSGCNIKCKVIEVPNTMNSSESNDLYIKFIESSESRSLSDGVHIDYTYHVGPKIGKEIYFKIKGIKRDTLLYNLGDRLILTKINNSNE